MNWTIAIPSYNRAEVLVKKTLTTLKKHKVPADRILIFVEQDQMEMYKSVVPSDYGTLKSRGKLGSVKDTYNFLSEYFPKDKPFLRIEDDISGFYEAKNGKLVEISNLVNLFDKGFELCKKLGFHLWGVYPVANAFYMKSKDDYTTDLKLIVGAFMGFINQKIKVEMNTKNDHELSLKYFLKDDGVLRFNHICVRYSTYTKGGMNDKKREERLKDEIVASNTLIEKYPEYVRMNPNRKGEVLMRSAKVKGGGKPVMRVVEGEADVSVKHMDIRNRQAYDEAKENLLEELRKTTLPKINMGEYNRGAKIGGIGRTIHFGFGDTRRGIKEYVTNGRYPELFRRLAEFGNRVVPKGWEYNGITLNHGVKAKKHKDSKNVGPSVIVGIGDFTGGGIKVWDKEDKNPKIYPLHDKPLMFNGGLLYHETEPFNGERYTMVFYRQMWEGQPKGVSMTGKGLWEQLSGAYGMPNPHESQDRRA